MVIPILCVNVAGMKTISKTQQRIEVRYLEQPFAALRQRKLSAYMKLMESLQQEEDQLVPVIVVPGQEQHWILIDGYLRVGALKKLGVDTVAAEIWSCDTATALLFLMIGTQQRPWEAIEQGQLLEILNKEYGISQVEIAKGIGRDVSWVNRRLALVQDISSNGFRAYSESKISKWALTRVIQPLARANSEHADRLIEYLYHTKQSTRSLEKYFNHYQRSNQKTRQKIVENPELFFKILEEKETDKKTEVLVNGPEGRWVDRLNVFMNTLRDLKNLVVTVFYPGQEKKCQEKLKNKFNQGVKSFSEYEKMTRKQINVVTTDTPDDTDLKK